MHYTAAYDSEMALLCAFFDVLPGAVGCRMYADREKGEYAYRLEQGGVWSPNGQLYGGMTPGEVHGETYRTAGEQNDIPQRLLDEISRCRKRQGLITAISCWRQTAITTAGLIW